MPLDRSTNIRPAIRIGALAPLTAPGWVEAGKHLLAGMELAASDINASGGVGGRPLELLLRDTAASAERATVAVEELHALGVAALAGEYHSVVARAAAAKADHMRLPFLCSSAVLDELTDQPTEWVARLAPPQSRGWRYFATHLRATGHFRIAAVAARSVYWTTGIRILRDEFMKFGGDVVEIEADSNSPQGVCEAVLRHRASALLLLVGYPEPVVSIVRAARRHPKLGSLLIGAPAGQPEFHELASELGVDGASIPFLRYLPDHLQNSGERVDALLRQRLGTAPSFVAFEGYDTILVLATMMRMVGSDRESIGRAWRHVAADGTRGEIRFSRVPGVPVWQWAHAHLQIACRSTSEPGKFQVLRSRKIQLEGGQELGG